VIGNLVLAVAIALVFTLLGWALAGRIDHPWVNAYLAIAGVTLVLGAAGAPAGLIRERLCRSRGGEDATRLVLLRLGFLATLVIGILDVARFHRWDTVPVTLRVAGLAVTTLATAWTLWAVRSNPFFLPVMAIQSDRGHRLVSDGPYRIVRHPGYLGMVLSAPATALGLGSWAALVPGLACALLFVLRARHEDRFLTARLDGYLEYSHRVRYRLVPGVW
jgi:protein-S-isoprenylcysteine O-methyltransferase Ste14